MNTNANLLSLLLVAAPLVVGCGGEPMPTPANQPVKDKQPGSQMSAGMNVADAPESQPTAEQEATDEMGVQMKELGAQMKEMAAMMQSKSPTKKGGKAADMGAMNHEKMKAMGAKMKDMGAKMQAKGRAMTAAKSEPASGGADAIAPGKSMEDMGGEMMMMGSEMMMTGMPDKPGAAMAPDKMTNMGDGMMTLGHKMGPGMGSKTTPMKPMATPPASAAPMQPSSMPPMKHE